MDYMFLSVKVSQWKKNKKRFLKCVLKCLVVPVDASSTVAHCHQYVLC